MTTPNFNPLTFLAALGAGGIAVAPFALMQYNFPHPKGLITENMIDQIASNLPLWQSAMVPFFEGGMVFFAVLHFILLGWFFTKYFRAKSQGEYQNLEKNPLANASLLAPYLAVAMSFNVFIGVIRYFVPFLQTNFQALMAPALVAWIVLLGMNLWRVMQLLKINFTHNFDLKQAHFGWMLFPFSLGMTAVVGSGIAALAKQPEIAHWAAFLTLVAWTGSAFLLLGKLVTLFQIHYEKPGLPDRAFLPSTLAVVPILTVLGIAAFRLSHYMENQLHLHAEWLAPVSVSVTFAFQTFYLLFGLSLLKNYLTREFTKSDYYPSQWALICPFVAWSVLGAFVGFATASSPLFFGLQVLSMLVGIGFYGVIGMRMLRCAGILPGQAGKTCLG